MRHIICILSTLLLAIAFVQPLLAFNSSRIKIVIDNQKDFDALGSVINESLTEGVKTVEVVLKKGVYMFHNEHLTIADKHCPDLSLVIKGKNAVIMSGGTDLEKGGTERYMFGSSFVASNLSDVENFSDVYQMESLVEVVDLAGKICRVPCSDVTIRRVKDWSCARIELTSWYTSFSYGVTDISDGYVYFKADNLEPGLPHYGDYNVNYDYTVGHVYPRYRLLNLPLSGCPVLCEKGRVTTNTPSAVHQCEAHRFLTLSNTTLKRFTIRGIHFAGNNYLKSLIYFNGLKAESITIKKNEFSSLRGTAINVVSTNNVLVTDCSFHDNYATIISIANSSDNATITHNRFHNNGKGLKQTFCIVCRGGSYNISHNEISDFNYGAIGVGVWHGDNDSRRPCYGVVEKNHVYYTQEFIKNRYKWTLIDSGAIYVWTKNAGTVIRDNFIHDYVGMGSNRGIYCDDGTNNCSVYDNIVLNIDNCYSIDLRRSAVLEKEAVGSRSNENNRIYGNVFNNRFRFEGRTDDNTSVKGGNTVLIESEDNFPRLVINNVVEETEDLVAQYNEKKWYRRGKRLIR